VDSGRRLQRFQEELAASIFRVNEKVKAGKGGTHVRDRKNCVWVREHHSGSTDSGE
jgi:hypothetical protein